MDNLIENLRTVERLTEYVNRITDKGKTGLYVCPLCGSGEGAKHTAAFSINAKDPSHGRWTCFSCNESGDLFDLIAKVNGITGADRKEVFAKSLESACQEFGIEYMPTATAKSAKREASDDCSESVYDDFLKFLQTAGRKSLIDAFYMEMATKVDTPIISTGFNRLDDVLGGGLCEGLYTVGGISSVGKTSLILQLADNIAEQGFDVFYFSLEMSKYELIAKSLSRKTFTMNHCKDTPLARTVRGITVAKEWEKFTPEQHARLNEASSALKGVEGDVYLFEGIGDIGVNEVRAQVSQYIRITGRRPIVIIDYAQILAPTDIRATDKQNMDQAVIKLKRLSRDEKLTIIGVSSFNRGSYNDPVSFESFKESGAIEYTSDVLMGLQLHGAGGKNFDSTEAKIKDPREIELVVLKNRNGGLGTVNFDYFPKFNYFQERFEDFKK